MISIVIAIYNCKDYVLKTLESVKNQTYEDYEVLLIDDKSNDGSIDLIKDFIKDDKRFRLIYLQENSGAAVARNTGIEKAKGEYIAFLDSDDIWYYDKLEKQLKFMLDNEYPFSFTAYRKFGASITNDKDIVKAYDKLDYKKMLKANFIGLSTVMYNQKTLGKVYMPLMRKRQDYGLWLAMLKVTDYAYGLNVVLVDYLVRDDSLSSKKLKLLKYNWHLFRNVEGLGYIKSVRCLFSNVFYKLFVKW